MGLVPTLFVCWASDTSLPMHCMPITYPLVVHDQSAAYWREHTKWFESRHRHLLLGRHSLAYVVFWSGSLLTCLVWHRAGVCADWFSINGWPSGRRGVLDTLSGGGTAAATIYREDSSSLSRSRCIFARMACITRSFCLYFREYACLSLRSFAFLRIVQRIQR